MKVQPYVPEKTDMRDFTIKSLVLGLFWLFCIRRCKRLLGSQRRHDYLGQLSVSCPYAIAAFRLPFFRGSVLEQTTDPQRGIGRRGNSPQLRYSS
jgi:hypothetical protein